MTERRICLGPLKRDWFNMFKSAAQVAREHGLSLSGLQSVRRRMGWPNRVEIRRRRRSISDARFAERWAAGESLTALCREMRIDSRAMRERFEALGYSRPRGRVAKQASRIPGREAQVLPLLREGATNAEIARRLGVSRVALRSWITKAKPKSAALRDALAARAAMPTCWARVTPGRLGRVCALILAGKTDSEIAASEKLTPGGFCLWLQRWAPRSAKLRAALAARAEVAPSRWAVKAGFRGQRVVAGLKAGKSLAELAEVEGVDEKTLREWCFRWRKRLPALADALFDADIRFRPRVRE